MKHDFKQDVYSRERRKSVYTVQNKTYISKRPGRVFILFFAVVVGLVFYGAYTKPKGATSEEMSELEYYPQQESEFSITLAVSEQRVIVSEKLGELLVIEGTARNDNPDAKAFIKIACDQLDAQKKVLASQIQYCGVVISDQILKTLDQQGLKQALNNRFQIMESNSRILPGKTVQFMLVLPKHKKIKGFCLRIVHLEDY